jgi:hypothetical protein
LWSGSNKLCAARIDLIAIRSPFAFMVLYVAIVAILNVALGYALAVYLRSAIAGRRAADSGSRSSYDGRGDYGADDLYEQPTYEHELESSVSS